MITFKSKHLRAKASRSIALALVALTLVCTACSSEQLITPGNENGEALVTLSLNVPAATRALTQPEEEKVNSIQVLAFRPGGGAYEYAAVSTRTTDNITFQITLRKGTWDLVILANTPASLIGLTAGTSQATLLGSLTQTITAGTGWTTANLATTGIPMSSKVLPSTVIADNTAVGTSGVGNGISLYRMLAKADVTVAPAAQGDFELQTVRVYNYNSTGRIHPNTNVLLTNLPALPGKIKGDTPADLLRYTVAAGNTTHTERLIYLNESANPTPLSSMPLDNRTCLVVGGLYGVDGTPTYYRVDFSNLVSSADVYLDIIRNHWYQFNITGVAGRGYTDENTAFESRPSNMTVEVVPWNEEKIKDIVTDGQYGLGVNRKEFTFFKDAMTDHAVGGTNELLALTTYNGDWTVTVMDPDKTTPATASSDAKWLTVVAANPVAGSTAYHLKATGNTQQGFYIQTTENNDGAPRTAYIHVRVKNLIQEIKVTQTDKAAISLKLTNDSGDEVTELLWLNGDVASQDLIATWLPITKKCGITKANSTKGAFPFALPSGGLGANTNNGGTQTYNITPAAITTTDADYPFIDRSTIKTFSITADGTTLTKTVTLRQKNYALVPVGFKTLVLPGVAQTPIVHSNINWKVTVTDGANLLDVGTTTQGTADYTTTTSNFTYKFKANTYGTVKFTFSPAVATEPFADTTPIEVTVESVQTLPYPAYPGVIGYDPDSETLNLNGVGYMVYFKYGGIIGMYARGNNDTWSADDIAFNPTSIAFGANFDLSFPNGAGAAGQYSTVGNVNITGAFLSAANGRNGNGDPCRFMNLDGAGMTASEVKAAHGSGTVPDKGQWRLPTNSGADISVAFAPAQSNWVQGIAPSGESNAGHTFSGLAKGNSYADAAWNFLPAAGLRSVGTGTVYSQGSNGYYWSSTPINATNGYYLNFSGIAVNPGNNSNQSSGMAVRCVRQ